jgi:hypothetical protein
MPSVAFFFFFFFGLHNITSLLLYLAYNPGVKDHSCVP